ncbi:MAG: hypothetical protein N3A02_01690 [Rectinema sp.]|nr:hypothetical protein [Rectinema sp.]
MQHHLMHGLGNAANTVLIVGYMAQGTLGRKLKEGAKEVRIHGDWYPVRARIEEIDAFSAHADWQEALEWLGCVDRSQLQEVFLVHGESDALASMRQHVIDAGIKSVQIVEAGKEYRLA